MRWSQLGQALDDSDPREEGEAHFGRRELRVLWPNLRPHVKLAVWSAVLLVVAQGAALATPFLIRYGIDEGIGKKDPSRLTVAAVILLALSVINWITLRFSMQLGGRFGERALRSIRVRVFDHLTHLDLGFFEREKVGRLVARLTSDVETIQLFVTEGLVASIMTFMYLAGSISVLFLIDWKLALAGFGATLPLLTVSSLIFRNRSERAYRRVRDRIASVLSFMQETVRGVQVVQAFGRERVNGHLFREVNADWREANVESFRPSAVFFPLVELVGVLGTGVILAYGGWRTMQGEITVGVLAAFILYLNTTLDPITQLSQLYDTFQQAMAGLAKLAGLLDRRAEIVDVDGAVPLEMVNGAAGVDDVTFRYRDGLPDALANVSLDIAAGEVLALVGPTGAGKSSIAKLLLRFYDPTTGRITLDGRDLREVDLASLRKKTSMVPQEAFLFRGSIRDNIRFGRPDASDGDVEQVCRLLGIDEMIRRLPQGYDTEVRERGAALSGGERQMIALARAVLVDPRLLILDEATSALDAATESHVESALRLASHGRTTIVIAHRLSTAARANRVAVVDHGKIVEIGTHDELIGHPDGLYSKLYQHWLAN
ncbi:MAG TPA: ABC transporter ATP-binding protein [Actinomycetota bacterium]|jgi:ATP-binding cassette subfamily B protein|nr:ABC transporter ATP-binding protein [Actinomycetota bacterium]